jgi:hypothetical protein
MAKVGGVNQHAYEDCRGQQIADQESAVLELDSFVDLALEFGGWPCYSAPLFAPKIKFEIFLH